MTEAKSAKPYESSFLIPKSERLYKIDCLIFDNIPTSFYQLNFKKLRSGVTLTNIQKKRWDIERIVSERKFLEPEELTGLQIATTIAVYIDLIYFHKLKGHVDELRDISEKLEKQINELVEEVEFRSFLEMHPLWIDTLNLIKKYSLNQYNDKEDCSKDINKESTEIAKKMGKAAGPKLFFLPEEESDKVLGDEVEKDTFVPQLLFTLPFDKNKFTHPFKINDENIFYEFVMLQAGSALLWQQSALAIDGGALFLVNNFIGNYEDSVKYSIKTAKIRGIIITEEEIWNMFADLILLHEKGHSENYEKTDSRLGGWFEWLANTYMYEQALSFADKQEEPDQKKIIFVLMAMIELTKRRTSDKAAIKYINSEILFLHLLNESGLIDFENSTFNITHEGLKKLIDSIRKCQGFDCLEKEQKKISKIGKEKFINFWQNHFIDYDK